MRLTRALIKNFRSIDSLTLHFDPRCRVLVGINEAGKTNILKALSLLSPEHAPTADDIRVPAPDEDLILEGYVWFVFSLGREERLKLYEDIENRVLCGNSRRPIIRDGSTDLSLAQLCDSVTEGLYSVDLIEKTKRGFFWSFSKTHQVADDWLEPAANCPDNLKLTLDNGEQKLVKSFTLLHKDSIGEASEVHFVKASAKTVHNLIGKALIKYVEAELPDCILWRHSDEFLVPARIAMAEFAENPGTCLPLKNAFALAGVEDVSDAIEQVRQRSNGVRNLLDRVGTRTTEYIREVWPEYIGISVDLRENGQYLETAVNDVHNLYDFSRRSDGFKRFIAFLLMVSAPTKTKTLRDVLILNDDPDAGMHPSGARHVRDELIRISANNYVVYSTHSIFMIDREQISRHLIVKKQAEITSVEEVNDSTIVDEEVLYNALGFTFAELLKSHNLIFEGWRDKELFRVALSRVPSEYADIKEPFKAVGQCHVEGVKDVRRVAPFMELAGRECTIISDSDRVAREHQSEHMKHRIFGKWLRYDEILSNYRAVTGEDFIKRERLTEVFNTLAEELVATRATDIAELPDGAGVIQIIDKWLSKSGVDTPSRKSFLEKFKENVFSNLKQSHIRPEYYELLRNLAPRVKTPPNAGPQ